MSPLPFIVVSFAAAAASLLLSRREGPAAAAGLAGLLVATLAAGLISPGESVRLGSSDVLVGTSYARLFLVLAGATGLVTCLIGLATTWPAGLPVAMLAGLGGIGLALSVTDPLVAVVVLLATAVALSVAALSAPITIAELRAVSRSARLIVLAGALAVVSLAWVAPSLGGIGADAQAFGLADLAIVLAVAVRFGTIPFHRSVAGLTNSAPGPAVPLLLVWGPAALAVVAVGVTNGGIYPLLVPSGIGQLVTVILAMVTLVLGAVGAWLQDDLEHVVGYSIIQDAGFILLGLATAGTDGGAASRSWLLILVVVKTAFAAWSTVVAVRFRTARLPELGGWARRSPLLGIALAGIALATIGVPGLLAWQVRWSLVDGATGGLPALILVLGGLASLIYYGRIALVGLGRPSLLVAAATGDRPVSPARTGSTGQAIRSTWQANRAPIASGLVLVLVVLSLLVAGGGLGGPDAARAAGPLAAPSAGPLDSPAPGSLPPEPSPSG
jgi:NADH:ubiquinone oxidoreductase subunit 2 (subunit N)